MKYHTHNFEIKDLITQFLSAFDDVTIKRYNLDRKPTKQFQVRYVYAPKQRVIHDLINKSQHITLPAVAVSIAGISRDPGRVFNKTDGFYYPRNYNSPNISSAYDNVTPVNPVNIDVTLSIITKYQSDMDQIITNFAPYANPYIILSWKIPQAPRSDDAFIDAESPIQELRSEVLWNGEINLDYPKEMKSTDVYRVTADTNFTIKGWLFTKPPKTATGTIFDINTNMVTVDDIDSLKSGSLDDYKNLNNNYDT